MLPSNIKTLLQVVAGEAAIFGVVFGIPLLVSRPSREDLFLHWFGGWRPIVSGLVFSIALRIGLMAVLLGVGVLASLLGTKSQEWVHQLQPDVEQMVSARDLVENPAYFVLSLTLVSFVLGGLREELWRAGMFAGFRHALPQSLTEPAIRWTAVTVSALVFGIGHLPQGWGGVLLTGVLGVGLGMILLRKQSIWPAVFAHGFFDAATFLFLYAMVKFPALKGI
jgi:membrane protease YdiL (CAAX protease family)